MLVAIIVSGALGLAGLTIAVHLGVAPDVFGQSSALVIASGIVVFTVVASSGLMINRGRWARVTSAALVAVVLIVTGLTTPTVWSITAAAAALTAAFGLAGRWLAGWVRPRSAATGPGGRVVALLLGTLALVPAVGFASPGGLETGHGILGAAGVLLTWAYAKAQPWSLWGLRFGLPVVAIPAVAAGPPVGAAGLGAFVAALTWLAWTADARLAVTPLFDRLPGPRRGRATHPEGNKSP